MTNRITRTLVAVTAAAWALGAAAQQPPAQPAPPAPRPATQPGLQPAPAASPDMMAAFKKADANGDGRITRDEAEKLPGMAERFDALDKNKDGALDLGEFAAPKG
jgi:hypothetical protein